MAYLCESCSYNNHGWCTEYEFNGLKKKNIQRCKSFKMINNKNTNNQSDDNKEIKYSVIYEVFGVPGRDNGFKESFIYETKETDLDIIEEYVLEYLCQYFSASNVIIISIGLA